MNEVPEVFGQYVILDMLGKGGMAKVYRARQLNIERYVAIKIMSSALYDQEEFRVRFKREADLFAKLEHPHILPIYDYGEFDKFLYLVLRIMEGGTLEKLIHGKQFALSDLNRLVSQVAHALDYAHENSIVHRDLKPSNVLIDKFGNAYLMDFGIAKIISDAQSHKISTMLGTPAYMAPEQWKMEEIDGRVDIYSLGVIVYEMLTGKMPFSGQTPYHLMYAHLHEEPIPPSQIISVLSSDFDAVLLRALAKDPQSRYQTAGELADDLDDVILAQQADSRQDVATLQDSPDPDHLAATARTGMMGSILLALDRPNNRVYAVPKVEEFLAAVSDTEPANVVKRFDSWDLDEILQELEVPSDRVINTMQLASVLDNSRRRQSYLDILCHPVRLPQHLAQVSGQDRGLLVAEVVPGSIADHAGLMLGDTLVSLDGEPLRNQDDLFTLLSGDRVGKEVTIRYLRAGQVHETNAKLEDHQP